MLHLLRPGVVLLFRESKMKLLKSTVIATALSASLVAPAIANESSSAAASQFSATDMQQMFEQDARPMQVAALSRTEMKETDGASLVHGALFVGGGTLGGYAYVNNNPNWNWSGLTIAVLTGGTGALMRSFSGGAIATLGNMYAAQTRPCC